MNTRNIKYLDSFDLKASIACLKHIITSTVKFNCDSNALQSELQQLGLPREHSTSIKRIIDDHNEAIKTQLKADSLKGCLLQVTLFYTLTFHNYSFKNKNFKCIFKVFIL